VLERHRQQLLHPLGCLTLEGADVQQPADAPGSRPDSSAASSSAWLPATQPIHPDPRQGRQPAVDIPPDQPQHLRTARADPNRDRIRCRRPALRALDPVVLASTRAPPGSVDQISWMTSIASSSASTASAPVSLRPPIASTASGNPPAPMPSSKRPPESRSRLMAARASTAGGRSCRSTTSGARWMRSVRAAMNDSRVHVSMSSAVVIRVILASRCLRFGYHAHDRCRYARERFRVSSRDARRCRPDQHDKAELSDG
jgi:hypothetical protein